MDAARVSPEVYRQIVRNVPQRHDLAALCGVCRGFRRAAEPALYNTITVSDADERVCVTLAGSSRIAAMVVALTVQKQMQVMEHGSEGSSRHGESDSEDAGDDASGGRRARSPSRTERSFLTARDESPSLTPGHYYLSASPSSPPARTSASDDYWSAIAAALLNTTRLRHLTIDIADSADGAAARASILEGCTFQLRTFHCDFDWSAALCAFLRTQIQLYDLYLHDYREIQTAIHGEDRGASPVAPASSTPPLPATVLSEPADEPHAPAVHYATPASASPRSHDTVPADTHESTIPPPFIPPETTLSLPENLSPPELPSLSILECTFSEAAVALAPGRPLTRLKTCFSRPPSERDGELRALVGAVRRSKTPLHALDIAAYDSVNTESSALELLRRITHTQATVRALRYLGTLILPIGGRKRLQFYSLLMRVPLLRCVEMDITAWDPAPTSPAALRAIAAELRLYCRNVQIVVFVYGGDFTRTIVSVAPGTGVLRVDNDANPDLFWREI